MFSVVPVTLIVPKLPARTPAYVTFMVVIEPPAKFIRPVPAYPDPKALTTSVPLVIVKTPWLVTELRAT